MSKRRVSTPAPRIRVAAILCKDNALLLVQHEKDGHTYWLLPGGGVECGESLAQALEREVREETGLDITVRDIAFVNDSLPPDRHRHIVNVCFLGEILGGTLRPGDDPRLEDVRFVPFSDLRHLDMVPDIREWLYRLFKSPDSAAPVYLGNLWRELS